MKTARAYIEDVFRYVTGIKDLIEIFHRDIKSYLGMDDASSHTFDSLHAHVHWVYCAHILLNDFDGSNEFGINMKQDIVQAKCENENLKNILKKNSQFNNERGCMPHK
ncbi:MAG: hypothetical protein HQK53_17425 [Oligoflexia bacterium]|nr:hypothetical protein [Oligoflexia bacterium]